MPKSKFKQLLKSKYINWLIAKNKIERKYFWIRFIMFSIIIIVLAHLWFTGWTQERYIAIPEETAWDLNPIMWPPYYLAGHTHVRSDMYKGFWDPIIPPLQYIGLYILSLIYWLFISFSISKLLTQKKFKTGLFITKSQMNKGEERDKS